MLCGFSLATGDGADVDLIETDRLRPLGHGWVAESVLVDDAAPIPGAGGQLRVGPVFELCIMRCRHGARAG